MTRGAQKGNRNALKHGYYKQKGAIKRRGTKAIDLRTREGKDLVAWERGMIKDTGGLEALSEMRRDVIEAEKLKHFLLQVGTKWFFSHPEAVVNARKRTFNPLVWELVTLADKHERGMLLVSDPKLDKKVREKTPLEWLEEDIERQRKEEGTDQNQE